MTLVAPTVRRLLRRLGFGRKKDRGRDGTRRLAEGSLVGAGRRRGRSRATGVFVDEMGADTALCPLYAWLPKAKGRTPGCRLSGARTPPR
jgi:hypothetical protein